MPNNCWYRGHKYECGLSLSCVFGGNKALDLCNGGMIWSCCVPRDRVREGDEEAYGSVSNASECRAEGQSVKTTR